MKKNAKKLTTYERLQQLGAVVLLPIWTVGSVFFLGGGIASLVAMAAVGQLGLTPANTKSALFLMSLNVLVYIIGLAILLIEPYAIRRMNRKQIQELLGMSKWPNIRDVVTAGIAWAGYFIATLIVVAVFAGLFPWFNGQQTQQIGFETTGPWLDKLAAFIVIVIGAPVVEELIFRGYLQGSLRRYIPWWVAAVITSVMFGVAHRQWNVGVDTFMLSMVACYLRERTGSIWAGIFLHMLKNFIAYTVLFLAPPWIITLLGG